MIKEQLRKVEIGTEKEQDMLENQAKIVFLGIGSNLGLRKKNIEKAKFYLFQNDLHFISISNYYETLSWPNPNDPKFLNIVLKIKSKLNPLDLLNLCKNIEIKLGRTKSVKNAPRVCDLDIIDFDGYTLSRTDIVNLPHKLMHTRNFVLLPLFEINKDWIHPVTKNHIKKLILSLPNRDIRSIKQI